MIYITSSPSDCIVFLSPQWTRGLFPEHYFLIISKMDQGIVGRRQVVCSLQHYNDLYGINNLGYKEAYDIFMEHWRVPIEVCRTIIPPLEQLTLLVTDLDWVHREYAHFCLESA